MVHHTGVMETIKLSLLENVKRHRQEQRSKKRVDRLCWVLKALESSDHQSLFPVVCGLRCKHKQTCMHNAYCPLKVCKITTTVKTCQRLTLFNELHSFPQEQKHPPSLSYPCKGSTTMARGWVIFPSMRVLRVCEAFSSRATLMVFLGPSSVQYKLLAIQSTAIPSTVWIPDTNTYCWGLLLLQEVFLIFSYVSL